MGNLPRYKTTDSLLFTVTKIIQPRSDIRLNERSRYLNLGEWLHYRTYAVFDGEELRLERFE